MFRRPSARLLAIALLSILAHIPVTRAQSPSPGLDPSPAGLIGAPSATSQRAPLFTYAVDTGVGETDNVTLVSTNKVSQTLATATSILP